MASMILPTEVSEQINPSKSFIKAKTGFTEKNIAALVGSELLVVSFCGKYEWY